MCPITANSVAQMSAVRWCQGLMAAGAVAVLSAGCSSSKESAPPSASDPAAAAAPGISPGGVTTSVNAPANSTEEQYYQACHWAKTWMNEKGGDPHAQIEPYLAMVQASPTGEKGTWNTPWAQLTPPQQSAVIVAVKGAADGACE